MEVGIVPEQPLPVTEAVTALLEQASGGADPADPGPWWRAGLAGAGEGGSAGT
ncbi:MAG: hypothetical protein ACRDM1_01840 [Gaiellaceae bacterium]